jgi:hypothetical protein
MGARQDVDSASTPRRDGAIQETSRPFHRARRYHHVWKNRYMGDTRAAWFEAGVPSASAATKIRVRDPRNEQGLPVQLCQPEGSWASIWPDLIHYG